MNSSKPQVWFGVAAARVSLNSFMVTDFVDARVHVLGLSHGSDAVPAPYHEGLALGRCRRV